MNIKDVANGLIKKMESSLGNYNPPPETKRQLVKSLVIDKIEFHIVFITTIALSTPLTSKEVSLDQWKDILSLIEKNNYDNACMGKHPFEAAIQGEACTKCGLKYTNHIHTH